MCCVFVLKCSNGIEVLFFQDLRLCCVGRCVYNWGLYLLLVSTVFVVCVVEFHVLCELYVSYLCV